MRTIQAFLRRLARLISRRDSDIADEIESNLQLHADENMRRGMTPQQARREAVIRFGGVESAKEAYRERATLPAFENLFRDVRFAVRQLSKHPGFTCIAILMLALGMCASVAIFAFVDAALIKPLPYQSPKRLVGVYEKIVPTCLLCNLSYPDYLDWKRSNTVFSSFDVYRADHFIMNTPSGAQGMRGVRVTDGFFRTLGVSPILGRDFRSGEDLLGAPRTLILSYSAWQNRYGGKTSVLGQSIVLDGHANTIIGVLPRGFHFAPVEPAEYWATMHASSECDLRRSCHSIFGVARLNDGVSIQAALTNVASIAKRLENQYPGSNGGQGAALAPLSDVIVGDIRPILLILLAGACLLLLIAAVNVTSLVLVRTEGRRREIAVRTGLGASPGRIIGQFIAEGLVLVSAGTAIGLVTAFGATRVLLSLISPDMLLRMPFLNGLGLNLRVLVFAGLVAFLFMVLCSFTPSLPVSISDMRSGLAVGTRGSSGTAWRRLGSKLVVVELATAVVLLVGAGLLGQSLHRLLSVKIGLQPDHLLVSYIAAPDARYLNDQQNIALERAVERTITSLPGVTSADISTDAPVGFNSDTTWFRVLGRPWHGEHNDTPERDVSTGYFKTIGAVLLRGRYFSESEDASKPHVAIVNQAFAAHYFPGEDPLGKKLSPLGDPPVPIEIVGLVEDIKEGPPNEATRPVLYFPFNQSSTHDFGLFVRTTLPDLSLMPAITAAIHSIDPNIVVQPGQTMTQHIDESQAAYVHRLLAWLVGGFALLAVVLAVVGLYGVIAYSVGQRTREIGVRMALGAQQNSVYRLILTEAGWLSATGIGIGLVCAVAFSTLMRDLLFGVGAFDLPTLASVALTLTSAALVASFVPARRAALVNPTEALRAE